MTNSTIIDTLAEARRLRDAGLPEPQADAIASLVGRHTNAIDISTLVTKADLATLATKTDLANLETKMIGEIGKLRAEFSTGLGIVRSDVATEMGNSRADVLKTMFQLILSAVVINVVAIVGAMYGLAKLLGH
jgi:hypothetical protein